MRRETNRIVIASIAIASVLIISLIGFLIAKASRRESENKFAQELSSFDKSKFESESASTQIGKSIEESEDEENEDDFQTVELIQNTVNNTSNNTNNITTTTSSSNEKNTTTQNQVEENKIQPTNATIEKNEVKVEFEAPVKGEILREFAKDTLVFSNTLQEWITHNGVDIKADKTTVVKAAAAGTVASIKNDPRFGLTVIINHDNGYKTIYSNLLSAEFVVKGEKVEKGQSIGTVGNSSSFEISDDYHLHFELIRDNEYLDPVIYINFE